MARSGNKTYNYNATVRDQFARHENQSGEIGIEIECEGTHLPAAKDISEYWTIHADGSLRGESAEYVMTKPVNRKNVWPALEYLEKLFAECKTKLKESYRTSVHVHVNMQKIPIRQIFNVILMYGIVEDILTEYAGVTRVGNLFCLRMSDAEFMLQELRQAAERDSYQALNSNGLRYAGCNIKSLFDHNSLEFRAFRGTSDMKLISEWIDIILNIKDSALTYQNPSEMLQNFSNLGPEGFINKNFSPTLRRVIESAPQWRDKITTGVRLVQDVAYANDWAPTPEKSSTEKRELKMAYYELNNIDLAQLLNAVPDEVLAAGRARIRAPVGGLGIRPQPAPQDAWPAREEEEL